jgi:hypothetical protein
MPSTRLNFTAHPVGCGGGGSRNARLVSAMDSKSIIDRAHDIGDAVKVALQRAATDSQFFEPRMVAAFLCYFRPKNALSMSGFGS